MLANAAKGVKKSVGTLVNSYYLYLIKDYKSRLLMECMKGEGNEIVSESFVRVGLIHYV